MTYTVQFSDQFAAEFQRFPAGQQITVANFAAHYSAQGFMGLPGKLSQSWRTLHPSHPDYAYTYTNCLWHYHIGIPYYKPSKSGAGYQTSDWVLHFQWIDWDKQSKSITLVDLYDHYMNGKFYLPPPSALPPSAPQP